MATVDRKTGQVYNLVEVFKSIFQQQWFIDQMVRMKNEVTHDHLQSNRKVLK